MTGSTQSQQTPAEQWPSIGDALPRRGNWLTVAAGRGLLRLLGWRVVGTVANTPRMVLVGAPHTSNWDFVLTLATMFALGVRFSWVAKHTLFRGPVAGLLEWLGGVRLNRQTSIGFVEQMVVEYARRPHFLLAIMPEGTRSRVRKWRTGFYFIALRAGVPILPVIFDYGRKRLRLGPAFQPTGDLDADLPRIQALYAGARGRRSAGATP